MMSITGKVKGHSQTGTVEMRVVWNGFGGGVPLFLIAEVYENRGEKKYCKPGEGEKLGKGTDIIRANH